MNNTPVPSQASPPAPDARKRAPMKKNTKILIAIVAVLVVAVGVFAILNAGSLDLKAQLQADAEFILADAAGRELARVTMEDVLALSPKEITATMDTSISDPEQVKFTAAPVKDILAAKGVDIADYAVLEVNALDGYASAATAEEVAQEDNVYMCIAMNGQALKTKSEGGMGPYLMIIKDSKFSLRWCKYVQELRLK